MQLANAHTAAVPQEHPTRRTAMLGAAVLPLTGASVGQDPNAGPLLMACARLQALCSTPLPDAAADADEAIMTRPDLFKAEIRSRTAHMGQLMCGQTGVRTG